MSNTNDLIRRSDAIEYIKLQRWRRFDGMTIEDAIITMISEVPSAQPEHDTPKRVLWTGWNGYRNTRYKCPDCKKPVRNDDAYCHRCGQRLMFPHISFTPYIEGQKQETIVRWDDEE